jgi:type II secretory pathway predicted ATPase ExeA/septal ring-binding cell division protein DamX
MNTQEKYENEQTAIEHSPFDKSVEISRFFPGGKRGEILDSLVDAITAGIPIVTLTGEEGSGKTMMCRMVEDSLSSRYAVVLFPQTVDSFEDVVKVVAQRLGMEPLSLTAGDIASLLQAIISLIHNRNIRLLLIFDEAERVYLATLERIRKMLDLANESGVFMQIVLAGKMGLHNNFKHLALCNFQQAEEVHFSLEPLTGDETYEYLNQAMKGERAERRGIFTHEVAAKIFSSARGNFRLINGLADEALQTLAADTSFLVLLDSVQENQEKSRPRRRLTSVGATKKIAINNRKLILAAGIACLVFVLIAFLRSGQKTEHPSSTNIPETKNTIVIAKSESMEKTPGPTGDIPKEERPQGDADKVPPVADRMAAPEGKQEEQQPTPPPAVAQLDKSEEKLPLTSTQSLETAKEKEKVAVTPIAEVREAEPSKETLQTTKIVPQAESKHETPPALIANTEIEKKPERQEAAPMPIQQSAKVEKTPPVSSSGAQSEGMKKESSEKTAVSVSPVQQEKEKNTLPLEKKTSDEADQEKLSSPVKNIEAKKVVKHRDSPTSVVSTTEVREPTKIVKSKEKTKMIEVQSPIKAAVDLKKQSPPSVNAPSPATQAVTKPEEVKVETKKAPEVANKGENIDRVYNRRIAAGTAWLLGQKSDRYTIQLMVVTSGDAEKKVKNMLADEKYRGQADKLYILRNEANPDVQYVYYGDYPTMTDARNARNTMPEFLRNHKPYAMSVKGAVRKAQEEE